MSHGHHHGYSRRDFLKQGGVALGGFALAAYSQNSNFIELKAVLSPDGQSNAALAAVGAADTIFVNGNIVTIDKKRTIAKALAVKSGLILQVGDDQSVQKLADANTKVIDLKGRTVTPGLIDAHCHLAAAGLLGTAYVDLSWPKVFTIADMQKKMAERIAKTPNGEWVVGSGWVIYNGRYPNKHDLDPISPKHPVFILNQGGHMAAVNSFALELAGVTAKTPDPRNGKFIREANNEPNGTIMNHPAMDVFRRYWPRDLLDVKVHETSILNPQAAFAAMGVTSFQDVYARDMERLQAYFNIAKRGEMTIRGQVMTVLEYYQELNGRIKNVEAIRYESDYMHFAGAKFQVDGAMEASYTSEPHDGIAWNIPIWKPNELNEAVKAFHDAGYQVALHTIGDAAVDIALDAIEKAMNANPRPDPRHRLEHSVLNSDRALKRTKDLGVVVSTQPTMILAFGDAAERIWGKERMNRICPTRTWLDMGIPVCLSSDAPSMPWWDPQNTLHSSIIRKTFTNKLVSPEQAMTIDEAMYAHTMAGAYADFAETKKGSLEAGKFADLVVWHDNPYTMKPDDLLNLKADLTMVGGKIVYQA